MKKFDPLVRVKKFYDLQLINERTFQKIIEREKVVKELVNKIVKLSNIEYPLYYIEPILYIATSPLELEQYSLIYARTIPYCSRENKIEVLIQISAPLVLHGLQGTIYAVMAHEFLHYLNILKNIINMDITSDSLSNTLFESSLRDNEKLIDQSKVFKNDRYLQKLLKIKFGNGFYDEKLNKKTEKLWLKQKLPIKKISIEENFTNLPFSAFSNTEIEEFLKNKIKQYTK